MCEKKETKYLIIALSTSESYPIWYQKVEGYEKLKKYFDYMLKVDSLTSIVIHVVKNLNE